MYSTQKTPLIMLWQHFRAVLGYFGPLGPNLARKCGLGAGVGPGGVKSSEMSLNCLFYWSSIHSNRVYVHIGALKYEFPW